MDEKTGIQKVLKYDVLCTTPELKSAYAYKAQNVLRLNHNVMGKWKREGISQAEYDTLPASWKLTFKYSDGLLSDADWNKFKADIFDPLQEIVTKQILETREVLKNVDTYIIDLDNLTEVK